MSKNQTTYTVEEQKLLESLCQILYEKSGCNILTLDVKAFSTMTDFYILCEGNVSKHVQALCRAIIDYLDQEKIGHREEGYAEGDWIVIDTGSVVLHLMTEEIRHIYDLEELWRDAEIVSVNIKTHVTTTTCQNR